MKACVLATLFMGLAFASLGQQSISAPAAVNRQTEEYCQLKAIQQFSGKVAVSIDYGQRRKLVSQNLLRDASGEPVEFNSVVDALNWLNSQGWLFVNAYVKVNDGSSTSYYIMRRPVAS